MAENTDSENTDSENTDSTAPLREEWLFTGRRAILKQILAWIHEQVPGAFVVTGSAGSGKSAILARIVALSESTQRQALLAHAPLDPEEPDPGLGAIDAAVHLRGLGAHDVATMLADRLRLPVPEDCLQLVEAVARMPYPPLLAFDGLDEAIPEQFTAIVTSLLVPLSALASVLLATRYQEPEPPQPWSGQTAAMRLGELFGADVRVVDLDSEPDTARDIEQYVVRKLRCAGRADLVPRVAPVLAGRATAQRGGFLYARTMACQIARGMIEVHAEGWEGQLAATAVGALEQDLASRTRVRDGVELPDAARDLLRALAWGMGRGMPRGGVWEAAAAAMSPTGVEYHAADLDWVLDHYGCYILADRQDGEVVYRLAHREFVECLLAFSPHVAGRAAGQALAEDLVVLAQRQITEKTLVSDQLSQGGAAQRCSPYLPRYLPRHATHGGPTAVAALRRLGEADPEGFLPGLVAALQDFAAYLLSVGDREAALIAIRHTAETYRALVDANPSAYLPGLATILGSLATRHAELGQHDTALVAARESTEIYRQLTEASPKSYFTALVMSLKNFTHQLAAVDRISAGVDVYTRCIETCAASPDCRDTLIVERAGFHINHGDAATGLRELVTLLTLDDGETPDTVVLLARNVLRAHRLRDADAVIRAWRAVADTEPPDWLVLSETQIGVVTEWITTPSWVESKNFCAAHIEELLDDSATVVLDEFAMVARDRVELHRHLLDEVRKHGLEAAYRPLLLWDLLTEWVKLTDWQDSQSFAEAHATDLLTVEAEVALIRLGNPVGTLVHHVLLRLARRDGISAAYACLTDRQRAAARMQRALAEVDPDPIAELAALEGQIFGKRFTGAVHLFVAALLMGETVTDFTKLVELAEQADPADRQQVAAEITDLISRLPDRAEVFAVLPEILLSPAPSGDMPELSDPS